jgi:electron transfer flavoprotein alpha subunit
VTVLVFCEVLDGKLKKASREALSIGRKLAEAAGGDLVAFANDRAAAADAGRYGAKKLYVTNAGGYNTESYAAAMQEAISQSSASIVLLGGTSNGRDLAPRLAARLSAGVASDVDRLEWTGGKLRARRPVYSGKAFATVEISGTPAIATARINAFPAEESGGEAAEVVEISAATDSKTKVVETKVAEAGEMSIAEADIIVSGGRGLKEAANFALVRDLAHAIGGAVGASRRPDASSARTCTSPRVYRAPFSIWRGCRHRSTSSPSTKTARRRSSGSRTSVWSAISSRFCRR